MTGKRLVIGLTGGIGTGKSTALNVFEKLGAATVSLDQIAKEQAKPGRKGYKSIVKIFGTCILNVDRSINRALLGRVIFSDKRAKLGLERATHPLILKEMKELIGRLNGVVIVDVPLLFEKKLEKNFDATILISCKPKTQLQRIERRDGMELAEARLRVKAQLPLAQKRKLSDVTIDNDKSVAVLETKISEYYLGLTLLHRGSSHGHPN